MVNAKEELLEHIEEVGKEVLRVKICNPRGPYYAKSDKIIQGAVEDIIDQLDFDYEDGGACQVLFGFVWFKDGSWSDRYEHDGQEWWVHRTPPNFDSVF